MATEKKDYRILIFAGIAVISFFLTVCFYETGLFRMSPIHSDGNGYYMYLPAAFVYQDLGMHFAAELPEDISGFSGTFFFIEETGQYVDKYTMGVAVLQMPFFLLAHLLTILFAPAQADGFSLLYQWGNVAAGCTCYFLGSAAVYRLIRKYTDEHSAFGSVLMITFGTGLFHYITMDGSYSHVYSYALIAWFILLVDCHEREKKPSLKVLGGICFGLLTLVRVTNVVVLLIYVLYRVNSLESLWGRIREILRPKELLPIAAGMVPIWIPQLLYWKWAAGSFFVNSYDLPGNIWNEHFDWLSPKLIEVLFLPNRGLFFWCPVTILAVAGFVVCIRFRPERTDGIGRGNMFSSRNFILGMSISFALFTYITASWWAYDGFCGFTNRFFTDFSSVYMFGIALLLHYIREKGKKPAKILVRLFGFLSLLWTNLFMIEYWNRSTTMFAVTMESIREVFLWYLQLAGQIF